MENQAQDQLIPISEASRLLGVCQATLRDWDAKGLFPAVWTAGGHRRFRLSDIKRVQAKGFSKTNLPPTPSDETQKGL